MVSDAACPSTGRYHPPTVLIDPSSQRRKVAKNPRSGSKASLDQTRKDPYAPLDSIRLGTNKRRLRRVREIGCDLKGSLQRFGEFL